MKKISKLLCVMMILAMAFSFAACGGSDNAEDNVLSMACSAGFPPYEYYEGGEPVGIDIEIAGAIADKLGMELDVQDMEFNSIIAAVQSGKVDMGMSGMTVTEERLQSINFSDSYAQGVQVVIVRKDSPITSLDDLSVEGKNWKIGVQESTTGDIYATGDFEEKGLATIERYSKGADAVAALDANKIDCVITDDNPAKQYIKGNDNMKILDTEYVVEDYAIAIAKENDELLDKINTALGELIEDGTVQSIIDKYISAE